ncbi:hypothetical protein Ahy_A07g036589 isoform A [Arachis hypogaea]|uniref:Uncharacterized protein n=1 Tax=Arachis hypogaea TaxID=3818 RepID=A0A445CGJ5_ARAHY|nr:hypothetical protein Ahy_A07g036589 isoform A [Arachis hypogaea]
MTTILNPMMADHKSRFERLTRQVERIARIVDYDEGESITLEEITRGWKIFFKMKIIFQIEKIPAWFVEVKMLMMLCMVYVVIAIRKLLNMHISDLAHLAEKVRQTELMKKEKEKYRNEQRSKSQPFTRKEKVAYVTMESSDEEFDFETEVDLAELKKGPPYSQVRPVYPRTGDGVLDFLVQQKIKDRDVFNGLETVKNSKGVITCIDVILNGGIKHHLEINTLSIEGEPGDTLEGKEEEGVSIKVRNFKLRQVPSPAKMEKGKAVAQSSGIDKHKDFDVDEEYFDEGDDDMVGRISIIPTEYLGECESNSDEDYDQEDEEAFSFIRIEDEPSLFSCPTERQMSHPRPLHIVAIVNGFKINKVLLDFGRTFGEVALSRYALRADGLGLSFLKTSKAELWTRLRKFSTTW